MPHGNQNTIGSQLAEIRLKQKFKPLSEGSAVPGKTQQYKQQHKQGRHQKFHRFLKATAYTTGNYHHGHGDKNRMPCQQALGITHHIGENTLYTIRCQAGKQTTAGTKHIGQRPTRDDTVIGKNQKTRQHPCPTQHNPGTSGIFFCGERTHGIHRTLAPTTPYHDLSHHNGNTDHGYTDEINQYESTTTIFTGYIGKFPDISQADSRARRGQHKGQATGPLTMNRFAYAFHTVLPRLRAQALSAK